jgi:hypothetical protein
MSKVDALRAMREARFAARQATSAPAKSAPAKSAPAKSAPAAADPAAEAVPKAAKPAAKRAAKKAPATPPAGTESESGTQACGHRNMGGKSCTRPSGHSEKNHRYS